MASIGDLVDGMNSAVIRSGSDRKNTRK